MSQKLLKKENISQILSKDTVKERQLSNEMKQSFLDYSMSVIKSRALPDYRDGLKPVHRRIMYAAFQERLTHEDKYKKSAAIVGSVMGSYHPHGDAAIYEALVRMSQDFSLRYPLIQGQGNFGSIDGDSPAAMRYTEARLSQISSEFLEGVDESWVEDLNLMVDNYDQTKREPVSLPTLIPNVLINGGEGIAVGLATKIPPHNLSEVIDAAVALIDNPQLTPESLFNYIKGPDFPTGGEVLNYKAVKNYFLNSDKSDHSFRIRAKAFIEPLEDGRGSRIVFTEIPYGVKKSHILKRIADLINPDPKKGSYLKELGDYIDEVRDESNREGIRIVIECDAYCEPTIVLNNLYKHTRLQLTYSPNLTVLVDNEPKRLSIHQILVLYLDHQRKILKARFQYKANKLSERLHILEGRLLMIDDIVEAVKIITHSDDPDKELSSKYKLDDIQLKDILSLPIGRLKKFSSEKMRTEKQEKTDELNRIKELIASDTLRDEELKKRLIDIKNKYGDERRTLINENEYETGSISEDSLIFYLPSIVILSKEVKKQGETYLYINKTSLDSFKERKLASKKTDQGPKLFGNSSPSSVIYCQGGDDIFFFTKTPTPREYRVYRKQVHELNITGKRERGSSILNVEKRLSLSDTHIISVAKEDYSHQPENTYIICATHLGLMRVTSFLHFRYMNSLGKKAYVTKQKGDRLTHVLKVKLPKKADSWPFRALVVLISSQARCVCLKFDDFRVQSRSAGGKKAMRLEGSQLIGISVVPYESYNSSYVFTINKYGQGKLTKLSEYKKTKPGSKGIVTQRIAYRSSIWKTVDTLLKISNTIGYKQLQAKNLPKAISSYVENKLKKLQDLKISKRVYDALGGKINVKEMGKYLKRIDEEAKSLLEAGGISISKQHVKTKTNKSTAGLNKEIQKLYNAMHWTIDDRGHLVAGFVVDPEKDEDILIMTHNNRVIRFKATEIKKSSRDTQGQPIFKGIEVNNRYEYETILKLVVENEIQETGQKIIIEGHIVQKTYNDYIVSAVKIPSSQQ